MRDTLNSGRSMISRAARGFRAHASWLALLLIPAVATCGGGSKASSSTRLPSSPVASSSSAPNDASTSPTLTMPASRFAISLDDLGTSFITNVPDTFVLNAQNYGGSKTFNTPEEGVKLLNQWGYLGGYETGFRPEGNEQAILQDGSYMISLEMHLFKDENGARQAYDYFESKLKSGSAQPVNAPQLGNKSSAWKLVNGKIAGSTIDAAYHRFMFRRGNLVTVVLTYGADPFMTINVARDLAQIVDAKALGTKPAIEPTPTSNYATPTFTPKQSPSPSPAGR